MTDERHVAATNSRRGTIAAIYHALDAPRWASPNLDGLADVLRDLSWLPDGPIRLVLTRSPHLPDEDRQAIDQVLHRAVRESVGSPHPLSVS